MTTEQQQFIESVRAQLERYRKDRARYIELANKPYKECTDAENAEALWLDENLPRTFTAEAAEKLLQIIDALEAETHHDLAEALEHHAPADMIPEVTPSLELIRMMGERLKAQQGHR